MPQDENRTPQHQVAVVDGRLVVDGQTISNSNDLLSSRRPLTEIVGKAYDAEDNSLWLATRNQGLFKVVLRALLD
jgi:type IV secretory pathway protease TraF